MNRDNIRPQTCSVHQHTFVGVLMYIACLCLNLVSVHFYAIPITLINFYLLYNFSSAQPTFKVGCIIKSL